MQIEPKRMLGHLYYAGVKLCAFAKRGRYACTASGLRVRAGKENTSFHHCNATTLPKYYIYTRIYSMYICAHCTADVLVRARSRKSQ